MLIYHPAYEAYHCIFRALMATDKIKKLELQKLRILDFFLCFPAELQKIRLPENLKDVRKTAQGFANEYHGPVSMMQSFRDLEHIQLTAYRTLAASGIFDPQEFEAGVIFRTEKELPEKISQAVANARMITPNAAELVLDRVASIPLTGVDGLKHRSGLLDYRYDVI